MQRYEQVSEFKEKLVAVNRVSKTVKGGRNMRFSALVVVGDENGRVGAGMGKAAEIPEAIRKANEDAKKHMVNVSLNGTTVPHESTAYFSTAKVVLIPAPEGTGVIAGGATRAVLELAGVKDIRTKSRYPRYRHQVLRHQQPHQHGEGHAGGSASDAQRRAGGEAPRQDRGRAAGLRRRTI